MSGVQKIIVADDDTDQRLDRWLRRLFPHVSQGRIEKMCRKGDLRVEGGRVKPSTRVMAGQSVRVPPLPAKDLRPNDTAERRLSDADIKLIQSCVIYRDDNVIALNKPHGLAVQGGSGQSRHVDGLAEALRFGYEDKPKLVHRLDKDTSGVLLLARDRLSAKALTAAFRHRETQKIYWAVVAGVPHPKLGMIKTGLVKGFGHGDKGEGEKMYNIHPRDIDDTPGAKKAITDYVVLEPAGRRAAWMALQPITGRTHQLRAHMGELGHPIVGDGKYGGSSQENMGDGWGAQLGGDISKKLHLHARSLKIQHPVNKSVLHITAPLPPHMQDTWDYFQWNPKDVAEDPFEEPE